jgi:hypothetical protein
VAHYSVEVSEAADEVVASLPEIEVETVEVAMLVPPDSRMDPRAQADTLVSTDAARAEADRLRVEADGLRAAYTTAARFQADSPEWQKAAEEAFRKLNGSLPGAYEFRFVRDGAKTKVLKLKCGQCPSTLPRAPRPAPAGQLEMTL